MPHFNWPRGENPDLSQAYAERMKLAPDMHRLFEKQAPEAVAYMRKCFRDGLEADTIYWLFFKTWTGQGHNINPAALRMEIDYLEQEMKNEPQDH